MASIVPLGLVDEEQQNLDVGQLQPQDLAAGVEQEVLPHAEGDVVEDQQHTPPNEGAAAVQPPEQPAVPGSPPGSSGSDSSSSSSESGIAEVENPHVAHVAAIIQGMGAENQGCKNRVYLGTFSHLLPETIDVQGLLDPKDLTREQVARAVMDAWNNPIQSNRGGRPRAANAAGTDGAVVEKLVVFREHHASGGVHFHIAVKLTRSLSFLRAKTTLRERHCLASHWSCTHQMFYSAVRYGHIPSEKKLEVDQEPFQWSANGKVLDLFGESQQPWCAPSWRKRREAEAKDVAAGKKKQRGPAFSKLDLTALILDNELTTRAAVLEFAQKRGTHAMQTFVHQHQRKIKEFLEDSREWQAARQDALLERETDWALLCRAAAGVCPHGNACGYAASVAQIFERNRAVLSAEELAVALREIIVKGPSKTTRVPMIVGPTNSGKTTLVVPFDELFGQHKVFHKPAPGSKFALRNIMKDKRFLFWDDFRPVDCARDTVLTPTLLSLFQGQPFEVQVSQSFNDGNIDFEWRRGAVVTAKEEGLWTPSRDVSAEDVRHLQSRFQVFRVSVQVPCLRATSPCAIHMARWICDAAMASDTRQLVQRPLPLAAPGPMAGGTHLPPQQRQLVPASAQIAGSSTPGVEGMATLILATRIAPSVATAVEQELAEMGAVHVRELPAAEWPQLHAWAQLKPLEQRRILAWLQ